MAKTLENATNYLRKIWLILWARCKVLKLGAVGELLV